MPVPMSITLHHVLPCRTGTNTDAEDARPQAWRLARSAYKYEGAYTKAETEPVTLSIYTSTDGNTDANTHSAPALVCCLRSTFALQRAPCPMSCILCVMMSCAARPGCRPTGGGCITDFALSKLSDGMEYSRKSRTPHVDRCMTFLPADS